MKRKRHWFIKCILAALLTVLALVLALPWLASSGPGRNMILGVVNGRIPGQVEVDAWTLSWRRPLAAGPLRYTAAGETVSLVEIARVSLEHGLIGLARSYPNLGTINVAEPVVLIPASPPAKEDGPASSPTVKTPSPDPGVPDDRDGDAKERSPVMPPIKAKLAVENGTIGLVVPGQAHTLLAQDISLELALNEPGQASSLELTAMTGDDQGSLAMGLTTTVPEGGALDPLSLPVDASAEVSSFDLAFLQPLLTLPEDVPSIDGRLHATLSAKGDLGQGLRVVGTAGVTGLAVPSENLTFEDMSFAFEGTVTENSAVVDRAHMKSGFFELTADGTYGGPADGSFRADASMDLDRATVLLRHLGAMPTNLVAGGALTVQAAGHSRDGSMFLERGEAVLRDLKVTVDGRTLSQPEIRLTAAATVVPAERSAMTTNATLRTGLGVLHLSKGEVLDWRDARAQFTAEGTLEADLLALTREAAAFSGGSATSGAFIAEGRIEVPFVSRGNGPSLDVAIRPMVRDLKLPDRNLVLGDISGTVELRLDAGGGVGLKTFDVDAGVAAIQGTGGYVPGKGAELSVDAVSRLGDLTPLLHALGILPEDIELAGALVTKGAGTYAENVVRVTQGTTRVTDLSVKRGEHQIAQREITLDHTGAANLESRTFISDTVRLVSEVGEVRILKASVDDWSRKPLQVDLEAETTMDLGALVTLLAGWGAAPDDLVAGGQGSATMSLAPASGDGLRLVADASVKDASFKTGDLPLTKSEGLTVGLTVEADRAFDRIEVQRAAVSSAPADLSATGTFARVEGVRDLRAAGRMAADLDQVTTLIQAFTDMDLTMSGKEEGDFHFVSRSPEGADWRATLAGTEGRADLAVGRIDLLGLQLADLSVPVVFAEAQGRAQVRGVVNEGALALDPKVDFSAEHPAVSLPESTNALVGLQLTSELADSLLGRIHPLFKGATIVGGTMGLRVDHLNWPLESAQRNAASLAGKMVFEDLELAATGMLKTILDALKIKERSVSVGQRDIDFSLVDGRVRTSPTRIRVKDHEIVLEGTMGLDQTLDYHAIVPITEDLVGRDAYAYLAGTTFRLPIRGTASKPEVNLRSLQEGLAGLAGQAARKALEEKAGQLFERLLK